VLDLAKIPDRVWLLIVVMLGTVAGVRALVEAFPDPLTIPDDARQFVFWMSGWRDPEVYHGDFVADYWRSVSPWLFSGVYRVFDLAGIDPVTTSRLLPAILYPLIGTFAYRFARTITDEGSVACLGATVLMIALVIEDDVVSATPRAFAPLFFLLVLDGLARRSIGQLVVGLFCLGGTYPSVAVIGVSVLGVAFIDFSRRTIDVSWRNVVFVGAGVVAAIAAFLPFAGAVARFGPTATPMTARQFGDFAPGGRTVVFDEDGTIDFFCNSRMGLIPGCNGADSLSFWLAIVGIAAAPTILLVMHVRSRGKSGSAIPFAVGLAGAVWFALSVAVAFKLYLPNRYLMRTLPVVVAMPYGILIGLAVRDGIGRVFSGVTRQRVEIVTAFVGLAAIFAFVAIQPPRGYSTWNKPQLAAAIASLPTGTLVAGLVSDTDFVPVLAKKRVLFSRELSAAYQLGYHRQIETRMRDMVEAELTPDEAVLAQKLAANQVDVYLIASDSLADARVDPRYAGNLGDFIEKKRADLGAASTALSRLAPECRQGVFDGVEVLDAQCLIAAARS
jgi:hypothetical protein